MTYRVEGVEDFRRLAAALKASGDRDLKNRTAKAIREAGKPMVSRIRTEGAEQLPAAGGLFRRVEGYPVSISTRWTGSNPSILMNFRRVAGYEHGKLRHPVFGNRDRWVSQPVGSAGEWTRAFQRHAHEAVPKIQAAVAAALDEVARKV